MGLIIGVVAAVLLGLGGATAATVVVANNSSPDKTVNFNDVHQPQPWSAVPNYGDK